MLGPQVVDTAAMALAEVPARSRRDEATAAGADRFATLDHLSHALAFGLMLRAVAGLRGLSGLDGSEA
jgi:hypothetical protein